MFCGFATLSFFSNPLNKVIQLFGEEGRNTGLITYFALIILFLITLLMFDNLSVRVIVSAFQITGLISLIYSSIQWLDLDPFNWLNPYSPVISFFGNPNFNSSFLGIFSATIWPILISRISKLKFLFLLIVQMVNILLIIKTESKQGLILFFAGLIITVIIYTNTSFNLRKLQPLAIVSFTVILTSLILDVLQKAPWRSVLYEDSVSIRGDLWRAAWRMGIDNPLSGLGFDSFGFYYRQYRDQVAVLERGWQSHSSAAHNVPLDFLTIGGFPLFLSYLLLNFIILKAAVKAIKNSNTFDPVLVALTSGWMCFQLQSIISINQIGLAIWGWILGAGIIAYERNLSSTSIIFNIQSTVKSFTLHLFGIIVGILISIPYFNADASFRSAIESKKIESVLASAYQWPQTPGRMFQVSYVFKANNLVDLSNQVSSDAVKKFPLSYENWEFYYTRNNLSESDRRKALKIIGNLDPYNPITK